MLCGIVRWRKLALSGAAFVVLALAAPVFAQTAMIRGRVVDDKGQPVEGAKVTATRVGDANSRKWEITTDKRGEFVLATLAGSGRYTLLAQKDKVGANQVTLNARLGIPINTEIKLVAGGQVVTAEQAQKSNALNALFTAGLAASQAGDHPTSIAKFTEAVAQDPACADCYYNIGVSHSALKAWDAAETAFKKAIELQPDYAEAYQGLTSVYSAQKKMDLAQQAAAKAAELGGAPGGGGNVEALYNQGVLLWNQGKVPEAKAAFEAAIKADASHAPAHYQYGMALLNDGKVAEAATEFQTYLKLAPDGENAAQAKAMLSQLPK